MEISKRQVGIADSHMCITHELRVYLHNLRSNEKNIYFLRNMKWQKGHVGFEFIF